MNAPAGFLTFLVLTVWLLVVVIVTGFRAKRKVHLTFVCLAVASLGVTIYYAERLGELYDLDSAGVIYPIHLWIAKCATVSYLLPVATGITTLRKPKVKRLHRRAAYLVVTLTLAAAGTGAAMLLMADRLPV